MRLFTRNYKQIEMVLLLSVVEFIFHFLTDCGIFEYVPKPVYDRFLITGIIVMCIGKLLDIHNKYKGMAILGLLFFCSICILLYYSVTVFDYLAFFVCAFVDVQMIFYVRSRTPKNEVD